VLWLVHRYVPLAPRLRNAAGGRPAARSSSGEAPGILVVGGPG